VRDSLMQVVPCVAQLAAKLGTELPGQVGMHVRDSLMQVMPCVAQLAAKLGTELPGEVGMHVCDSLMQVMPCVAQLPGQMGMHVRDVAVDLLRDRGRQPIPQLLMTLSQAIGHMRGEPDGVPFPPLHKTLQQHGWHFSAVAESLQDAPKTAI